MICTRCRNDVPIEDITEYEDLEELYCTACLDKAYFPVLNKPLFIVEDDFEN